MSEPRDFDREAREAAASAMLDAIFSVGANGGPLIVRPTQTAAELRAEHEAAEKATAAPSAPPVVPMTREQILNAKIAEAERERARLQRKLEKKMRKAGR